VPTSSSVLLFNYQSYNPGYEGDISPKRRKAITNHKLKLNETKYLIIVTVINKSIFRYSDQINLNSNVNGVVSRRWWCMSDAEYM